MGTTMTFSCDDALKEIESEYTAFPLKTRSGKTVNLRSLLMLGDEGLKTAQVVTSALGDDSGDDLEKLGHMRNLLLLVADQPAVLKAEMKDWPIGMFMRVLDGWQVATALGEAEPSDS